MRVTILILAIAIAALIEEKGAPTFAWFIIVVAFLDYFSPALRRWKRSYDALYEKLSSTKGGSLVIALTLLAGSIALTGIMVFVLISSGLLG